MSDIAPVAMFIFNRPHLTRQVYDRVRAARPKRLLAIADGPRSDRTGEAQLCQEARDVIAPDWDCELLTNFSAQNLGCKRRLSSGLDWVFQQCEEAIVLEDDCLPSASFFEFCSAMLARYRDDARVWHVSGDNFQDGHRRGSASYYFSRYTLSWGWATWRRAWSHYDVNISNWPTAYRARWLESILDSPREVVQWECTFDSLYRGLIDTWDYQWLFACWRNNGLAILPNKNLVTNIGFGPDATHFREDHSTLGVAAHEFGDWVHPAEIRRDEEADQYLFQRHIASGPMPATGGWASRLRSSLAIRSKLRRVLPRSLHYRTAWL